MQRITKNDHKRITEGAKGYADSQLNVVKMSRKWEKIRAEYEIEQTKLFLKKRTTVEDKKLIGKKVLLIQLIYRNLGYSHRYSDYYKCIDTFEATILKFTDKGIRIKYANGEEKVLYSVIGIVGEI